VQPPPSAVNVTLPAFAAEAECRCLLHGARSAPAAIDRCSARRALSRKLAAHCCCCRSMGQTDGQTRDCYTDPAPHTMRAASATNTEVLLCSTRYGADTLSFLPANKSFGLNARISWTSASQLDSLCCDLSFCTNSLRRCCCCKPTAHCNKLCELSGALPPPRALPRPLS